MPVAFQKPVEDSVAKINDEVAVGEDLVFQEKWWRFERAIWILFTAVILLDLAGAFGRGPIAHGHLASGDSTLAVKYDRIERAGTPTILDVSFGPSAIQNGKVRLFVSESIVTDLGAQRVVPAPDSTEVGNGGLTYTFPASVPPAAVQFALQPSGAGVYPFTLQVPGSQPIHARVVVVP
jgi:hypothetical protein